MAVWCGMKILSNKILERLRVKPQCMIFSDDISRVWPLPKAVEDKRERAIHAFAKKLGMSAVIHDSGIRVVFRKLATPGVVDAGSA
jgi:hypothetical protein